MSLSISPIFLLRAITSSASVCTIFAMVFSPATAVCWRSAAPTAAAASASALRTLRLDSHRASRLTPTRRIAAGVW